MDTEILLALNGLRSAALDPVLGFLSEWGLYAYPLLFTLALALPRRRAHAASVRDGWLAFLFSLFVTESILKPLIARPRPTADAALLARLHVLGSLPRSTGMPSGTAAACAAGAVWLWLRFGPRVGAPAIALALVVSLSRVYAGVHWPSDIAVGALVGALSAVAVDRFARWSERA